MVYLSREKGKNGRKQGTDDTASLTAGMWVFCFFFITTGHEFNLLIPDMESCLFSTEVGEAAARADESNLCHSVGVTPSTTS